MVYSIMTLTCTCSEVAFDTVFLGSMAVYDLLTLLPIDLLTLLHALRVIALPISVKYIALA